MLTVQFSPAFVVLKIFPALPARTPVFSLKKNMSPQKNSGRTIVFQLLPPSVVFINKPLYDERYPVSLLR